MIGIVYGALVSLVQPDFKKLVAYSSVSHLGFVMLGIFALTVQSVQGALMVMINHGISTGALFFLIGMIYERRHTRLIEAYGGIARVVPMFAAMLTIVTFSSIGVPGHERLRRRVPRADRLVPHAADPRRDRDDRRHHRRGVSALGHPAHPLQSARQAGERAHSGPQPARARLLMAPLVACIIWLGVYPAPVLRRMEASAEQFVRTVETRAAHADRSSSRRESLMMHASISRIPSQLTLALVPDLVLMGGAMVLLLWRRVAPASQRRISAASACSRIGARAASRSSLCLMRWASATLATGGPIALDNFRWMVDVVILLGTIGRDRAEHRRQRSRSGIDDRRDARAHPVRVVGHDAARRRARPDDRLPRHRADVDLGLRARRHQPPQRAVGRRRAQVLPARRVLDGVPALRHRARVRRDRLDEPHDDRRAHRRCTTSAASPLLLVGIAMLLVGFGFKVATVPFHMWAPDVYDGAPIADHGVHGGDGEGGGVRRVPARVARGVPVQFDDAGIARVGGLAIATMVVGNAIGLAAEEPQAHARVLEHRARRLHPRRHRGGHVAGLVGVAVLSLRLHARDVRRVRGRRRARRATGRATVMLDELAGLWTVRPWLALAMAVLMLALLGFPIFGGAGFFAKWYVLQAALQAPVPQTTLAVVLVLTTVISAGYYLYVVMVMFMRPRAGTLRCRETPAWTARRHGARLRVALILVLGVVPELRRRASRSGRPRMDVEPLDRRRRATGAARPIRRGSARSDAARVPLIDGAALRPRPFSSRPPMAISAGIFRQYDIRGIVDQDLTVEAARAIGGAYAALHAPSTACTGAVAVGRDNRPSGAALRDALVDGLTDVRRRRRRHRRRADAAQLLGAASSRRRRRHPDHRLAQSARVQRLQAVARQGVAARRATFSISMR